MATQNFISKQQKQNNCQIKCKINAYKCLQKVLKENKLSRAHFFKKQIIYKSYELGESE